MWPHDPVAVVYEWEVFRDGDLLGPCGTNEFSTTAMERLAEALRAVGCPAWGRISRRVFLYGMPPHDRSLRVMIRADLDEAGALSWTSM